jgi:hypothetical protein
MNDAAVFCTAHLSSDPRRYQAWIDYYSSYFAGAGVDLYLYNDGPLLAGMTWRDVRAEGFAEHLGRQSVFRFPGWKRSFSQAIRALGAKYRWLGHIESDCGLAPAAKDRYLNALRTPGYRIGFTNRYNFPETGLQIVNSEAARDWFCTRYADPASYEENVRIESVIGAELAPEYFFSGERYEGNPKYFDARFDYLCQCSLDQFCVLFGIESVSLGDNHEQ